MKKTISIIGSRGVPACYGGFETLTQNIAIGLVKDFALLITCEKDLKSQKLPSSLYNNITRIFIKWKANGWQSIFHDTFALSKVISKSDIILILGTGIGLLFPIFRFIHRNKTIVLHVDGIEWKRGKWSLIVKKILKISFIVGCKSSSAIITDSLLIKRYIGIYLNNTIPITDIKYGYSISANKTEVNSEKYFLTIARAEKENNLELIADYFKNAPEENWKLVTNYSETSFGRQLFKKYSPYSNIEIIKANYDSDFLNTIRSNTQAYIHGHTVGGCNPTLVEMTPYQKPLLCFDNFFNRETTFNSAFYFNTVETLKNLIKYTEYKQSNYKAMYQKAKITYNWKQITKEYINLFSSL